MEIEWARFSPQTLLAVSVALIPTNAPDLAERRWRCAVFANETGQTEEAKKLAAAAAEADPSMRERSL
jgi:hypothetical protein